MVNIKVAAGLTAAGLLIGGITGSALAGDNGSDDKEPVGRVLVSDRSEQGAATAAARYSQAIGEALLSSESQRRQLIQMLSTGRAFAEILDKQLRDYEVLDEAFSLREGSETVVLQGAPLGYRMLSYSADAARVSVYSVGVVGKPGVGSGPAAGFGTTTMDLRWEQDAWRLAELPQDEDGPTPPLLGETATPDELLQATKDLKRYSHASG